MHRRALAIREQVLGLEHPATANSYYWLASIYHQRRQYEEAERCYRRALAIYERALGSEHPTTKNARKYYTALQQSMNLSRGPVTRKCGLKDLLQNLFERRN